MAESQGDLELGLELATAAQHSSYVNASLKNGCVDTSTIRGTGLGDR